MPKLLNVDSSPKTVKGVRHGFSTAILYLAPWTASGKSVCPVAALAGCGESCLNVSGRGAIAPGGAVISTPAGELPDNAIQRARLTRTALYHSSRDEFMAQLVAEVEAFVRRAERLQLTPAIRLNGTSDIAYERRHPVTRNGIDYPSIMAAFPTVQCYDYTKRAHRFAHELPPNYHLTLSYSEANPAYAARCIAAHERGAALAVVVRDAKRKSEALAGIARGPIVDGDAHDLRFLDGAGTCVALKAKGKAKRDTSGFVVG